MFGNEFIFEVHTIDILCKLTLFITCKLIINSKLANVGPGYFELQNIPPKDDCCCHIFCRLKILGGFLDLFVIYLQHGMPFLLTAKKQHAKSYDANIHMPFYTTCPKADMPFYTTALKQT